MPKKIVEQEDKDFDFFNSPQPVVEEKIINKSNHKFVRTLIAAFTAIAGIVGMHLGIEYSGWLIFLAFCML